MVSGGERWKWLGERGDGFVEGEGVGGVVLKPLDGGIGDKDDI